MKLLQLDYVLHKIDKSRLIWISINELLDHVIPSWAIFGTLKDHPKEKFVIPKLEVQYTTRESEV